MSTLTLSIVAIIFGAVLGCGVAALALNKSRKIKHERLVAAISGRRDDLQALDKKKNKDHQGAETSSALDIALRLKQAAREQKTQHNTKSISSLIMQAGMETTLLRFWIYSLIFGTIVTALAWFSHLGVGVIILLAFSSYLGLPRFFLKFRASRRQRAFLDEFADALEAMIRLLKAGMPVSEAISMVAREFDGPVGDEMGRIYDAQKVGMPMAEAVRRMGPRMPLAEVQMFATAIAIQQQTGSSLSEVLGNLAGVIRARYRLKRKVQALSSEAKVSAMIIGALPIMVTLALWAVNPDYIGLLFTHPTGKMLLFGAIIWMSFGVLSMKMMINFKV